MTPVVPYRGLDSLFCLYTTCHVRRSAARSLKQRPSRQAYVTHPLAKRVSRKEYHTCSPLFFYYIVCNGVYIHYRFDGGRFFSWVLPASSKQCLSAFSKKAVCRRQLFQAKTNLREQNLSAWCVAMTWLKPNPEHICTREGKTRVQICLCARSLSYKKKLQRTI